MEAKFGLCFHKLLEIPLDECKRREIISRMNQEKIEGIDSEL